MVIDLSSVEQSNWAAKPVIKPDMSDDISLAARVARLKQIYIDSLAAKINNLETIHRQLCSQSNVADSINSLQHATHKISGSAGSYDFHQISSVAHDLEYMCRALKPNSVGEYCSHDIETLAQNLQVLINLLYAEID